MNRKFYSKEVVNEQFERGTTVFYKITNDMILITRWLLASIMQTKANLATNEKVVYMLSSYYNPVMIDTNKTDKS